MQRGRSAFNSQSLFTCLLAVAFRRKHTGKPLAPCLNKPPHHWKCILHTEGCHHRNGCSQLQNMAAPTSHRSCVCMDLGFIPATHCPEHWTILQRTIVSFCLNYSVENNWNNLLRHLNAAGCSNAWMLQNALLYISALSVFGQRSHQTGIVLSSSHSCA